MEKFIVGIVAFLVVLVVVYFVRKALIKKYTMDLMKLLVSQNENEFIKLLDSGMVKTLFVPFNREYMRLNFYIAHGQDSKIKEQVSLMDQMRVDRKQRYATYNTVFQYFISTNNETNARNMQRKMNAFIDENNLDPNMKYDLRMEIRMYFDKDMGTIPYIDEHLENANDQDKAVWNLRKAFVLKENNKLDEAIKCMEIVVKHTSDPTQKREMQELIDNNLKDL